MNSIKRTLFGVGDNTEGSLDLNQYLIKHPAATFFTRAAGHSMCNAGILDGDLLVVDRSLTPHDNSIVIVALNGELTVKRLKFINGRAFLYSADKNYQAIPIANDQTQQFWGVVTYAIHDLRAS